MEVLVGIAILTIGAALLGAGAQSAPAALPQPAHQQPTPSISGTGAKVPAAAEKKICRHEEVIGSTIRRHVCYTKDEWAEIEADNARNSERFVKERSRSASGRPR
jgi:hypothetical protein